MQHVVVSGLIGGLTVFALQSWLGWRSGKLVRVSPADRREGWRTIAYGGLLKAAALFCTLVALILGLAASHPAPDQRTAAAIVATCLVAGAIYMLYVTWLHQVRFNATTIQSVHPFLTRSFAFEELEQARHLRWLGCMRVKARDGRAFMIPVTRGLPLLNRYVRRLERGYLLDNVLRRRRLDPALLGGAATPAEIASRIGSASRMLSPVVRVVAIEGESVWPEQASEIASGRHVVAMLIEGEATLVCGRHSWAMQARDSIVVPPPFDRRLLIGASGERPARLLVISGLVANAQT